MRPANSNRKATCKMRLRRNKTSGESCPGTTERKSIKTRKIRKTRISINPARHSVRPRHTAGSIGPRSQPEMFPGR